MKKAEEKTEEKADLPQHTHEKRKEGKGETEKERERKGKKEEYKGDPLTQTHR